VALAVVLPGKPTIAKDIENCASGTYLLYNVAVTVVAVINDRTAVSPNSGPMGSVLEV
jgi:hypothetical protein